MGEVIDLSVLGKVKRESIFVLGLVDGSRIIAQVISEDEKFLTLTAPVRLIVRPMANGNIGVDFIDFVIGADEANSEAVLIKSSAEVFRYRPDERLINGYADHVLRSTASAKAAKIPVELSAVK